MSNATVIWIIVASGLLTYLTRVGGHIVLSRLPSIHPRAEAALDAVPAAVLTTLVAPEAMQGGAAGLVALAVAALVALRYGMMPTFLAGGAVIVGLRLAGF
jgi:uncharacterized membrane protein